MTKQKLFQSVPEDNRRKPFPFRATRKEADAIRFAAKIRNLTVTDYIIKCALGRRADVKFETEIVLTLRDVVSALRVLHTALVEHGIPPPKEAWAPVIDEAIAAMKRISK